MSHAMKLTDIYKFENKKATIELVVFSFDQLFDKRDPNPFLKNDLDEDASDYIITSAEEIGVKKLGKLKIYVKNSAETHNPRLIQKSIHKYFSYRLELNRRKIKKTLSTGYKSLAIGIVFLSFSVFLSRFIGDFDEKTLVNSFLKEGFLLLGWVSMWKPVNIFLYDWWPIMESQKVLSALSEVAIEFDFQKKFKPSNIKIINK